MTDQVQRFGASDSASENTEDPDFADLSGSSATLLDEMRSELAEPVKEKSGIHEVSTRAGYSLHCSHQLDQRQLARFRKKCVDKSMADDFDGVKLCCLVIAEYTWEIRRKGEVTRDKAGKPFSFKSKEFQGMLGVQSAAGAVEKFFGGTGGQGPIMGLANELTEKSGLGADAIQASGDSENP